MSQQPPPGWVPPGHSAPGVEAASSLTTDGTAYGSAYGSPPSVASWGMPVHKPGVVPLRPLTLGDFFDGAFKTIRRNPGAMVGLAAGVTTSFLVVLTLLVAATGSLDLTFFDSAATTGSARSFLETGGVTLLSYLGTLFAAMATVVLNGMLVRVVAEAVLGRRTTASQAWSATRGRLLRLVGLTMLNVAVVLLLVGVPIGVGVLIGFAVRVSVGLLVGLPLLLAGAVALFFVQVRFFQLAAPALVLERIGVFASLRRAGQLSRRQFWRLFGIQLLTALVVGLVSQVIAVPLGLAGILGPALFPGTAGALVLVFSTYLSQIVVGAVTTPFTSAVVALQYVDQRIRKEGLDVHLIAASQQAQPTSGQR